MNMAKIYGHGEIASHNLYLLGEQKTYLNILRDIKHSSNDFNNFNARVV